MSQWRINPKTASSILVRRSGLASFELQDEAVIYDIARDTVHYLNRTARFAWDRCDGSRSIAEIADELGLILSESNQISDEDRTAIEKGIVDSIEMLKSDGLLKARI